MTAEVKAAWERWLREIHWAYWVTGTFARPHGPAAATATVERWLAPLSPGVYAAIGIQWGPTAERLHVHMLVGGIRRRPLTATALRGRWIKSGHVQVEGYRPCKGGVEYLVRQADEIELIGTQPKPYRPNRRGGREHVKTRRNT
jgi:hypothetical protein